MFLRVLFLLLFALNLGSACWIAFAPPAERAAKPAHDAGVPALVLLSERERDDSSAAELASAPETTIAPGEAATCTSIGPFPTQADLRAAVSALTPLVRQIQFREDVVKQSRGYWVYLPAMKTREEALGIARQLSTKGVRDYYVVTAGDQQNTISLGLFREQANAERRRAEIAGMGFQPELTQRTEDVPTYWIDFAHDPAHPLDWRAAIAAPGSLREQPIGCF